MYGKLVRGTYRLLARAMRRDDFWKYYDELEKSQYLPLGEIRSLQLIRLKALLAHAYDNVPYYRRRFDEAGLKPRDIKTTDDLGKLPVLTKKDIRGNFDNLIAKNFPRKQMLPYSTSGSTGEPIRFYITRDTIAQRRAVGYRAHRWTGYEMGDGYVNLWDPPGYFRSRQLKNRLINLFFRVIYLNPLNMSEAELECFIPRLIRFRPYLIVAYSSAAYILASYIRSKGIERLMPKAVITVAEMLFDYQREAIKETLDCEVFESYACREVGLMAAECPSHSGYHIFAEKLILEFVRDGKPVASGETGKILVTDLTNYAMPFIRYENEDLGVPTTNKCPCGISLPLMESIVGKVTDILVVKDNIISSPGLNLIFRDLPINQYQVIQEKEDEILVKIVKGEGYTEAETEVLLKL
ncbi:phenylacetate--CoA ligase family protein, partial [Chloroflexota bacterium]